MSSEFPPYYDKEAIERIMRDRGVSADEAARIAATTMDGANEGSGGIDARQTYCGQLRYSETIGRSIGAEEGAMATLEAAAKRLGINISGLTRQQAEKAIDYATQRKYGLE